MTRRMGRLGRTLAHRVCADCRVTLGFAIWPWSGSMLTQSHGLCRRCVERRIGVRTLALELARTSH